MSKTLSTGTLSLRFMQNALHRQQLQEAILERAEVRDEGKWEVGWDVREAWGMDQGARHNDTVIYESSYLPFLFPSEHEDTEITKPLGRRTFDKKGQDVSASQFQATLQQTNDESDGDAKTTPLPGKSDGTVIKGRRLKAHANPVSISSLSVGKQLKGFQTFDQPSSEKELQQRRSIAGLKRKSAKQAIFDTSGVGTDIRSVKNLEGREDDNPAPPDQEEYGSKEGQERSQHSLNAVGFLKPAGVDEPASRTAEPMFRDKFSKPPSPPTPHTTDRARKRSRDSSDQSGKAKKKKKSAVEKTG